MADADAVILLTEHKEYQNIDLNELATKLATPILIDERNMVSKDAAAKAGLTYRGVGKAHNQNGTNRNYSGLSVLSQRQPKKSPNQQASPIPSLNWPLLNQRAALSLN